MSSSTDEALLRRWSVGDLVDRLPFVPCHFDQCLFVRALILWNGAKRKALTVEFAHNTTRVAHPLTASRHLHSKKQTLHDEEEADRAFSRHSS